MEVRKNQREKYLEGKSWCYELRGGFKILSFDLTAMHFHRIQRKRGEQFGKDKVKTDRRVLPFK